MRNADNLRSLQSILLKRRGWQFLRYLHFRDCLSRISDEVETVCICGAGHGLAELACAIEFPHITFTLTDIISDGYPHYHRTMSYAWQWGLVNMQFSVWNVLHATGRRFDLVASTEVLEHVPDIARAARNMRNAAKKYIYCLVPFADDPTNLNPIKREQAWIGHQHYVFGFDQKALESLFGQAEHLAGAYWKQAGVAFRRELAAMSDAEVESAAEDLLARAIRDLRDSVPESLGEAAGIKILAKANSSLTAGSPRLPPDLRDLHIELHGTR